MKILYDYQAFQLQKIGGISKSFVELISHLPSNVISVIAIKESDNLYLKDINKSISPLSKYLENFIVNRNFKGKNFLFNLFNKLPWYKSSTTINRSLCVSELVRGDFDIFHPTYFDSYFLKYLKGKPFVLTIHDMIPEIYYTQNDFQVRNKAKLAKYASHIIAVSNNTKEDIINIMNVPAEKISVIYHGVGNYVKKEYDNQYRFKKYFLFVGQRDGYKNFEKMLTQCSPFFLNNKDCQLICTGRDFDNSEIILINKLGLINQVRASLVSTNEMSKLYREAIAFIFPSEYEGFGIPIIEAFSEGCPVLLNNKSCFPEIAGNAALYFDLNDKYSCLKRLYEIYAMNLNDRKKLIKRGYDRLTLFNWDNSALLLSNVYKSLL